MGNDKEETYSIAKYDTGCFTYKSCSSYAFTVQYG